jgi:hypothetical protein
MTSLADRIKRIAHDPYWATDVRNVRSPYVARSALSAADVIAVEEQLGFSIPQLLHEIYTKVGNGGFGPGYGLLPLTLVGAKNPSHAALNLYLDHRKRSHQPGGRYWPERVLPISSWGCGVLSCIAAGEHDSPVFRFQPSADDEDTRRQVEGHQYIACGFFPESSGVSTWLEAWIKNYWLMSIASNLKPSTTNPWT